ncbi:GntR family transcriptional regulator [Leucobacter luti]|uniref:GntR family transcriptional regulator n=1 Tax=Leucobacter luti TaxID=340320 RepID=UPI001F53F85C|nr:UTRA domain-containing protein [Leucobacter luti]
MIEPAIAQKLSTLTEDFARAGVVTETEVLACELIAPLKPVAALLDLAPGAQVLRLARLRRTEQGPVALLHNYVRADIAPGIEQRDFVTLSLFGVLEDEYALRIGNARRTFSAEPASGEIAAALGLEPGAPVQYLQQVTYLADDRPVEYSDVWIHSGRLRVTSLLSRR